MGLQHHRRINFVSAAVFDTDMIRTSVWPFVCKRELFADKKKTYRDGYEEHGEKLACLAINYNTDDRAGEKNSSCRPFVSHNR